MKTFTLTVKGYACFALIFMLSTSLFAQDFNVQHLQNDMGNSGGTNTSFTTVSSLNNAFVLANNNRKVTAGTDGVTGNLDADDLSGARVLTGTGTLTYYRQSGSTATNTRFNSSIWEYIGPSGGNNEMIVRGRYTVDLNGATNSITQALSGISNAADCIPFITGILSDNTIDGGDSGTAIAYLEDATTLRVEKGTSANNVTVYITVVEFTGSNWTVLHGDSGDTAADTGTITLRNNSDGSGTATSVSAWSEAIIFSHHRGDDIGGTNQGIEDNWPLMDPGSNNETVDWTFQSGHLSNGTNRQFVHVLANSDLNVTRFSSNTSSTEGETIIDISSAGLSNTSEALIVGSSISTGGGTAYGRGWRNYYFNSAASASHWSHRSGNTMQHEIQIIDLSSLSTPTGPEINIQGNSNTIVDGDATPSATDDTDFGTVSTSGGTQVNTFTIQNTGTADLSLTGSSPYVSISGTNATDFTVTTIPSSTIGPSGSTTFQIAFNPIASGLRTASVSIANDDSDENPYNFDIQGTGNTPTYCSSNGNSTADEYIDRFQFAGIIDNNSSGEGTTSTGYSDFTAISADVNRSTNYSFTITPTWTGTVYDEGYAIWVDFNNDFDFEDAGELVFTQTPTVTTPISGSFTIPPGATLGSTRMRVSMKYNGIPTECESFDYGEVEDYTINILAVVSGPEINIQGNATTIVDGDTTPDVADNTDFGSITTSGGTQVNTFTIQNTGTTALSLTGGSPYVVISGAHAADFILTSTPNSSIASSGSTTFEITFNPSTDGTRTASVSIANNDTNEDPYNFDITGIGVTPPPPSANPGNIGSTDLQLWVKANAGTSTTTDGAEVTDWTDYSPNNFTVEQGGANAPIYTTDVINFNPALSFTRSQSRYFRIPTAEVDGTGLDIVPSPAAPTASKRSSMSIFAAFLTDGSGAGTMLSRADNDNRSYQLWLGDTDRVVHYTLARGTEPGINYGTIHARNAAKISSAVIDVDGASLVDNPNTSRIQRYVNGYLDPLTIKSNGDDGFGDGEINNVDVLIGARRNSANTGTGNVLTGNIAEIIVYDRILTTTERQKVESYMAIKYGITLGYNDEFYREEDTPDETPFGYSGTSNDYILSDDSMVWDGSDNTGYGYNVFGIARDDNSALLQLKSKSVHIEQISKDESIITLTDESGSIENDHDYLMIGNNGATVTLQSTTVPERVTQTINRVWKSREGTNDVGTVMLEFDLSQYSLSGPADLELIVADNTSFTNYKNYAGTYDSFTEVITFSGVNLKDNEYFTLAKTQELLDDYHFDFNGSTKYVDLEDNLDLTGDFTISAWIKRDVGSNDKSIISKRNSADSEGYDFRISSSGNLEMYWYNGSKRTVVSNTTIPIGRWHHVAAVYEGGTISLYIDGVFDNDANLPAPLATSHKAIIGAAGSTTISDFYNGDIDELRIFDIALPLTQLRFGMNQEIESDGTNIRGSYFESRGVVPTKNDLITYPWSSLIGYYKFSHVKGNCLFDESSYTSTNGRLYNTTNASIETQTAPLPFTSSQSGSWDTSSTWSNGSVQYVPGSASIVDTDITLDWSIVVTSHDISLSNASLPSANADNRTVLGLFVDANELTINGDNVSNTGNGLTVSHYMGLNGKIDLEGESQLIQPVNSDLDVTATGLLEKDQQGTADTFTYNYWSSPVGIVDIAKTNYRYTVQDIMLDGTNPVDFSSSGYDGADSTPIRIADYWIWKFANLTSDDYSAWQHVRRTGNIDAGEGFTMKGPGSGSILTDQNYVFLGKPNNGDITLTINAGNDYLVGNPYASAINADEFITDNTATSGTLYFWEHWGGGSHILQEYQGGYALYNLSGGVPAPAPDPDVAQVGVGTKIPGQYIPVSQGFFVSGTSSGTITFENDQRIFQKEGSSASVFLRGENVSTSETNTEDIDDRMKFRIGFNAGNDLQLHRQLLLTIDESTTLDYDWAFDALLYDNQTDDMFWMINDNKYVIQASNEVEMSTVYPLGVKTSIDGITSINIDALENVPDEINIYVHDIELNIYHDLRASEYEIFLNTGEYLDRFEITFATEAQLLGVDEEVSESLDVLYSNDKEKIVLINPNLVDIKSIELFNMLGQSVYTIENISESGYSEYEVKNLSAGTYIIKLYAVSGSVSTKKVLVK
ncbi:choice-of-anchor D domain-containing protein [Winogradskyella luteola]|uniref:Choice-of-anchor D domain-containing protein n=1 Tax=Winogradskyella luteola TaxID=2828330 RepID=A0A9X1F614_9FLAO|nr:choice-of-anchor D domain-containing protein [Winogradskyella luteola]MBV7267754.1 choice-of-anchor D domain-containing protein [Winogradskyella luteola]